MSEETQKLQQKVDDIALRGASKEDIAKLEKLISEGSAKPTVPPATAPAAPVATTPTPAESEELKTYRETERQGLLKDMPKDVIEEFKLAEKPLAEVKRINVLLKALHKRDVGVETPPIDAGDQPKRFRWNPATQKNEWW